MPKNGTGQGVAAAAKRKGLTRRRIGGWLGSVLIAWKQYEYVSAVSGVPRLQVLGDAFVEVILPLEKLHGVRPFPRLQGQA